MRATVNDKEVFLKEGELPAVTLSINSLTDPSKISGTTSTTIRVLATPEAKRVFGTEFMRDSPRAQRPEIRIGFGGVDYFRSAVLPVEQDRDEVQCLAQGGNAAWFDYAKDVQIDKFDLGMSDAPFNSDTIKATWTDEDSLLYFPIVDFGKFEGRDETFNVTMYDLPVAFRVHRLISTMMKPSGYKVLPMGTLAAKWKKFIVMDPAKKPLTAIPYGSKTGAVAFSFGPFSANITELGDPPGFLGMEFTSDDPGIIVNPYAYAAPADGLLSVRVESMGADFDPFDEPTDGAKFYLHVYNVTTSTILATVTGTYHSPDARIAWWHTFPDVPVSAGDEIKFSIQCDPATYLGGTADIYNVSAASLQMVDPFTPTTYIGWNATDLVFNAFNSVQAPIQQTGLPPSMSLMDLLKSISNDQCLVYVTQGKTIQLWYDREYYRKPVPGAPFRDWTARMDVTDAPVKLTPDRPRSAQFRFTADDSDKLLSEANDTMFAPGYGNADYALGGTLKETEIKLPFAPTIMGELFDGVIAPIMRKRDGTYQTDYRDRKPRILFADGLATGSWKFTTPQTDYPFCYFVTDLSTGTALHFDNAPAGYPGTVNKWWLRKLRAMRDGSMLEADIFIHDHEIQGFDHGLPTLVDDGSGPAWYYVQEITQHQFGTNDPTRCTLVQIPGKALSLRPGADVSYPVPPVPVCGIPDLSYEFIDNGDGTFNLEITMASSADFTPGDVYVEYDGTTPMGGDWSDDWSDDFNT